MELRRQFLVRCNVYPTLRRIAKDLGITYVTGYTKEGLVDAILNCEFPQQPVLNPPLPLNLLPPLMNNLPLQPYEQHPVLQQPEPVFHNPQLQQPALPPQQAPIDHIVRDMSLGIPELTIEDLIHNDLTNVTGSIVTFDLTAVTPLPSGLEEQTTIGGRGYLLLRETNITHIKRIVKEAKQQFDTYKNITFAGHLIRGFAGIGKSSNMYLIARCCREDGWAIIYLPAFASLASSDKEAAACRFLDSLKRNNMEQTLRRIPVEEGRTLFEVLEQKSAFSNELAKDVIQILIRQEELPVLIAIDQWNSIFRVKEMENTHFLHQFRTFDSLKSPSTVVLTAVSATSPWKIEGFVDAQATIYSSNLPKFKPYDDTEWERILRYTRQRANMEHLPEHLIEEVKRCSGRLPRLLFMFLQSCQNEGFADCLTDFKDKSTNEYISKITSLIDAVPESAKKKIYNTIGALWLGIALDPTFVPVDLYAFMIKENGVCKPVCDIARDALFKVIEKDMDGIIELLVQDPDFSWRAFELFFASRLQRTDPLTFTTAPLLKNSRQQQRQYTLNIGQIEKFSRNDAGLHQNQWIRRGSVIVCYRAFPVVDLVVYNSDGHLFLFQLSMQSYASHSTGVYDLLNKNVGQIPVLKWIVEQLKDPPGDLSRVVNHWIENRANGHPCTFSHTHLHYVYVSVEDPRCERGDRSGDPVEVVFGRQLLDFGKQAELFWKGRE